MKRIVLMMAMVGVALTAPAQDNDAKQSEYISVFQYWKEHNILQHLDLSVTAGTTGIGLEVSSPVTDWVQVRAGYDFMPRFTKKLKFGVMIGSEPAAGSEKFDRMSAMMETISGYKVEDHVDMIAKPTLNHFKLLVDVFPFKQNRHWHFTAGFYWGSGTIAVADNSTESMKSLLSVMMYNRMYENAKSNRPLFDFDKLFEIMYPDKDEDWRDEQISKYHLNVIPRELYDKIIAAGRLSFDLGYFNHDMVDDNGVEHKAGERYNFEPGSDGMVHVKATANKFKPYLGFGYGGRLAKGRDDWQISFDAGVLFWGGSPALYTHDGVDLVKDVRGITGQVGNYVDIAKAFKVYPVLNLKITKRIF